MLKNYFKIAIRNINRYKGYSVINITGLTIGMVCCLLISLYIIDELSFDRHHEKADRIYRVGTVRGANRRLTAYTSPPMAEAMKNDFPEIEEITRLCLWGWNRLVMYRDKQFLEKRIIGADSTVFDVFTIPFILGDPKTALTRPNTLVITEDMAHKYFGDENPIGKTLAFDDKNNLHEVTGVVENCLRRSHIQFDMIFSMATLDMRGRNSWMNHTFATYLVLRKGTHPDQLESKFLNFLIRHYGPRFYESKGIHLETYFAEAGEDEYYNYWLQPLLDIHLNARVNDGLETKGDIRYVYVFSAIAFFILLIACINFMNLSTARFANRSKEVGLRKVLGANRLQLVRQFIGESILFSVVSIILALTAVQVILPSFNYLAGRRLELNYFNNFYTLPILFGLSMLIGILAGSYPAFFLSAFKPVRTVQGSMDKKGGRKTLRRILVVLQFSVSIVILVCTFVVYSQLQYVRGTELGFDKEQIVVIHRANVIGVQRQAFHQELLKYPNILKVAKANTTPGRHFNGWGHIVEGRLRTEGYSLYTIWADYDFADLLDLEIVRGRYFSREMATDSMALIINEAAVREMGLSDPVGTRLLYDEEWGYYAVIGVVEDIHFQSLHHPIRPMVIYLISGDWGGYTLAKVSPQNIQETIRFIEETWRNFAGGQPFEFSFLDDDFDQLYRADGQTGRIFSVFTVLAILIACFGLYGLVSFTAEQRTKEIGIRKVVGASIPNLLVLLSKEVLSLILIAVAIASPLAFHFMNEWLQNFAYRIDLSLGIFLQSGLIVIVITLITTGYQTVKAAKTNPVDALRYE